MTANDWESIMYKYINMNVRRKKKGLYVCKIGRQRMNQ